LRGKEAVVVVKKVMFDGWLLKVVNSFQLDNGEF